MLLQLLLDVAQGLVAIHGHQPDSIIHRDLHIRNILVTSDGRAKLTDFGCGRAVSNDVLALAAGQTSQPGFLPIVPPEARSDPVAELHAPSPAYDIWGYGLLVVQLVACLHSVPPDKDWESLEDVQHGQR